MDDKVMQRILRRDVPFGLKSYRNLVSRTIFIANLTLFELLSRLWDRSNPKVALQENFLTKVLSR